MGAGKCAKYIYDSRFLRIYLYMNVRAINYINMIQNLLINGTN